MSTMTARALSHQSGGVTRYGGGGAHTLVTARMQSWRTVMPHELNEETIDNEKKKA